MFSGVVGIDHRRFEIEPRAFVRDLDDQALGVDFGAHVDVLGRIVAVAAQDGVGQRLGERDGDVEHELPLPVGQLDALAAHQLDDVLDVPNVVRDVEFDDPRRASP